jgi:N-methylhydantoinase A
MPTEPGWQVGIDIGGTFTDLVALHPATGEVRSGKVPTRRDDPVASIQAALAAAGLDAEAVDDLVHGTTLVTNAIVEDRVEPVALVTTRGFEDVLDIGRAGRQTLYRLDALPRRPAQVPPARRIGLAERVDHAGAAVLVPDAAALAEAAAAVGATGVESVAVSLLHSYANPAHERAMADALRGVAPFLSLSHMVNPETREFERTAATVLNASVMPIAARYLARLEREVRGARLHVMHSAGGMASPEAAARRPLAMALSGPAAGVSAAARVAADLGLERVLSFDMGGTTTDVCLIVGGTAEISTDSKLAGRPVRQPMVAVESIGAGGGSLVQFGTGGLSIGPESAGADPGPAAYGRGGTRPTVTDANAVLGYRDPTRRLGGAITLDVAAAEAAMRPLAERLGVGVIELALGVQRVANAAMVRALARVTVERGVDGRQCTLLAFGGAGPMHAAGLAREFGIAEIVVPRFSSAFSALGCIVADMSHTHAGGAAAEPFLGRRPLPGAARRMQATLTEPWRPGHGTDAITVGAPPSSAMSARATPSRCRSRCRSTSTGWGGVPPPPLRDLRLRHARDWEMQSSGCGRWCAAPASARHRRWPAALPVSTGPCWFEPPPRTRRRASTATTCRPAGGWPAPPSSRTPGRPSSFRPAGRSRPTPWAICASARPPDEECRRSLHRRGDPPRAHRGGRGDVLRRHALGALAAAARGGRPVVGHHRPQGRPDRPGPRHSDPSRRHELHGEEVPERVPAERLRPGDVWFLNLPEVGGNHLPDVKAIRPIFLEGHLFAFAVSLAHWGDIGGAWAGSYFAAATETWQEGVRIPPLRLFTADGIDAEARLPAGQPARPGRARGRHAGPGGGHARSRNPAAPAGGRTRCRHHPAAALDRLRRPVRGADARGHRRPAGWRLRGRGTSSTTTGRGRPAAIRVPRRDRRRPRAFRLLATDDAVAGPLNTTPFVAMAAVYYAIKAVASRKSAERRLPCAGGGDPAGLDPGARHRPPVVGGNHETSQRAVDAIMRALAAGAGRLTAGGSTTTGLLIFGGRRRDGDRHLLRDPWRWRVRASTATGSRSCACT